MKQPWRALGWLWAAPLTLVGLTYVNLFTLIGWYKRVDTSGDALVWQVMIDRLPRWLSSCWKHWTGQTLGNVVVVNTNLDTHRGRMVLRHEEEHVRQTMVLGVFYVLFYAVIWLGIKLACRRSNAFFSHPFEVESRRAAGQVIDVEGTLHKLRVERGQADT
jgi:hypothetical protein